jgi:hypothetical protein
MRLGIMQPYFFPYIGYFQLIASVDQFIVYDNIKFTKKGWINRNRFLQNGKDAMFSLSLKKDSDSLDICERELSTDFDRIKLLNQFKEAYNRAPYYSQTFTLLERIVNLEDTNLFRYIHSALVETCKHLGIDTQIKISSTFTINDNLRGQDRVLALSQAAGADIYVNAIGGMALYSKEAFEQKGIALRFLSSKSFVYPQFQETFVPWLSIIDILMFNSVEATRRAVSENMELIEN